MYFFSNLVGIVDRVEDLVSVCPKSIPRTLPTHHICGVGHVATCTGVAFDLMTHHIYSCSLDATLKVWDFETRDPLHTEDVGSPIARMAHAPDSGLVALACDDCVVRVRIFCLSFFSYHF